MGAMTIRWGMIGLAVAGLAACDKGGGAGKERGACYGNGTCDPGLVCLSELCVRPPPADCGKIGEKLASYRLGNYAPRDERASVVGELTAACEQARLTADEGACILDAKGRIELARCPRPLLAELAGDEQGCKAVAESLIGLLGRELAQGAPPADVIADLRAAIEASCVEDAWPDLAKTCISAATDLRHLDKCEDTLPRELQDRVQDRLGPILARMAAGAAAPTAPPVAPPE